jgi:carbamoyltransferase
MTAILGVNAFHADSSACLIRDGALIAAAEEERFRRIKHWAGFPSEAIRYCLSEAGLALADLDHVAINQDSGAHLGRKLAYTLVQRPDPGLVLERIRNRRDREDVVTYLARAFPEADFRGRVHNVEHHVAHLSSAFHASPFREAVVLSVDGFGDFASAAWGVGNGTRMEVEGRIHFPHSLGIFYQALTQFLGFPRYGDESKVMGLAPYGRPGYLEAMRRIVLLQEDGGFQLNLDLFRHHRERIEYQWENGPPEVGRLYSPGMIDLLGPARAPEEPLEQRHKDIARSAQAMYEEALFHLLDALHARHRLDALAMAGGCALNAAANGKVALRTPFRKLYVPPAAGDAGGAIGAATAVWHELGGLRGGAMDHAYWGPDCDESAVISVLDLRREEIAAAGCCVAHVAAEADLCRRTASAIAEGVVVGWFQGRMEWGARALGNRSIVCDPRRPGMKDVLNARIKHREAFRPFAPSILREKAPDWFEIEGEAPFMTRVIRIREDRRSTIPAVTHVDGSGRIQTVDRGSNPRFHQLIEAFEILTGVPMVLNTSFNENEPIVRAPGEALDCFLRTGMDLLVMGNWMVRQNGS